MPVETLPDVSVMWWAKQAERQIEARNARMKGGRMMVGYAIAITAVDKATPVIGGTIPLTKQR
jgi:hypothetical protein